MPPHIMMFKDWRKNRKNREDWTLESEFETRGSPCFGYWRKISFECTYYLGNWRKDRQALERETQIFHMRYVVQAV